jgi:hypothetical protein
MVMFIEFNYYIASSGFVCMLVATGHAREDGRDRVDYSSNTIPKAQRRSGPRVREAKVRDAG